jgi:hypothetical protein
MPASRRRVFRKHRAFAGMAGTSRLSHRSSQISQIPSRDVALWWLKGIPLAWQWPGRYSRLCGGEVVRAACEVRHRPHPPG